ncbi:MAG: 3'-5' exonuclease [Akkermansiaceae bacterium]|nr:3'-5' exonuclease [Akkermansiaceae bacterium]
MPESPPISSLRFCAIDFESAGARPGKTDVPVQIGLARWSLASGHQDPYVSYLASSEPVTWAARKVHGIGDEDLRHAPKIQEIWPAIRNHLDGHVVVAHGMGTEKRFLRAFPGHRFGPWIDTLLLAACPDRRWHDALFDARGSLHLLEKIIIDFALQDRPIDTLLHPDLTVWSKSRGR